MDLREVLAAIPAGVVVIAAPTPGGFRGLTATSLIPVSLEPPLVLVSVDETATTRHAAEDSGRFSVSVLERRHEFLAERFAGRAPSVRPDWEEVPHRRSPGGLPWIEGAVAWFECALQTSIAAGDHVLLLGLVDHAERGRGEPLVHWDRSFWRLA
jgi:flavin reductase (DIM6/NTAB) family NADH-FMN oxidoreductase RutF